MGTTGLPRNDRQRYEDLERRIGALERSNQLQSASIGAGGIRVYDGGSITLEDGGDLNLQPGGDINVEGGDLTIYEGATAIWKASEHPLQTRAWYAQGSGFNLGTTWTEYGRKTITLPDGYDWGNLLMVVDAGQSFDTTGNVSVVPWVQAPGYGKEYGSAVNSGNSNVSVALSFLSSGLNLAPVTEFDFGLDAIRVGTPSASPANSGNWHMSFQVIFTRISQFLT